MNFVRVPLKTSKNALPWGFALFVQIANKAMLCPCDIGDQMDYGGLVRRFRWSTSKLM